MPFLQLFYHFVWATQQRQPLITPSAEPLLYDFLRSKAIGLGGTVYAIGGVADHVHVVASVPPGISVSSFVGQVKGASSANLNRSGAMAGPRFAWQSDYGAFTFGQKRLPYVIAYVEGQKEHHAQRTFIPFLERSSGDTTSYLVREDGADYLEDYAEWHAEMMRI